MKYFLEARSRYSEMSNANVPVLCTDDQPQTSRITMHNKDASSRIRSARLKSSLVWWSGFLARADEQTNEGVPSGPRRPNNDKT